jgi:hypothetical protein
VSAAAAGKARRARRRASAHAADKAAVGIALLGTEADA